MKNKRFHKVLILLTFAVIQTFLIEILKAIDYTLAMLIAFFLGGIMSIIYDQIFIDK